MTSGFTLLAVTDAITVAPRAGAPVHKVQTSVAMCARIAFGSRKLWSFPTRYGAVVEPKWLIFGQPWIGCKRTHLAATEKGPPLGSPFPPLSGRGRYSLVIDNRR